MNEPKTSPPPDLAQARDLFDLQAGAVADRAGFEALRVAWQGRKRGVLRELEQRLSQAAPPERRTLGQAIHALKAHIEARVAELEATLLERERVAEHARAAIDPTLPGRRPALGSLHPVTRVTMELECVFAELGFSIAEGPEIEDDFHNFEALNIPADHPARDSQDTFFPADGRLLRTHTSPVQVRTMRARQPPIRVICPGRVYRVDNDLRHSPMFHQVEGLCVGEGITFGHLKGTLEAFQRRLFAPDTRVRLRPSFFQFTEPSAECDISCPFCGGTGTQPIGSPCGTCSASGWMELLGCGMVDPRVFSMCGIDPDRYTGWAFGLGLDRLAMLRYGFPNLRTLFDNDERLLRQIGG